MKKEGGGVKIKSLLVRSAELQGSAEELLEFAKSSRVMQSLQLIWDALSSASRGRRIVIPSGVPPTLLKTDLGFRTCAGLINKHN